jgi:hypothetical protein
MHQKRGKRRSQEIVAKRKKHQNENFIKKRNPKEPKAG